MSVYIKRVKDVDIRMAEFQHLEIGEFFEDREDEELYIKIDDERAIRLGDGEIVSYLEDALVNEVEADIKYRRIVCCN